MNLLVFNGGFVENVENDKNEEQLSYDEKFGLMAVIDGELVFGWFVDDNGQKNRMILHRATSKARAPLDLEPWKAARIHCLHWEIHRETHRANSPRDSLSKRIERLIEQISSRNSSRDSPRNSSRIGRREFARRAVVAVSARDSASYL